MMVWKVVSLGRKLISGELMMKHISRSLLVIGRDNMNRMPVALSCFPARRSKYI